jgi:hypothetical protein
MVEYSSQVAIFNLNYGRLFTEAEIKILELNAEPRRTLFDHPLEDGTTVTDYSIVEPIRMRLAVFLPPGFYASTHAQLREIFNTGSYIYVKSRGNIYDNLIIDAMPHEETAQFLESIQMEIDLREVQTAVTGTVSANSAQEATTYSPISPAAESTVQRGRQTSTPPITAPTVAVSPLLE